MKLGPADQQLVYQALLLATRAHHGQERKYTGEPYIVHPIKVAQLVARFRGPPQAQAAALLHDTVEDTDLTIADINLALREPTVADMVWDLTDQCHEGNRATRKRNEAIRLSKCNMTVQGIKLCDMISNTRTIVEHDPDFARVYLVEMQYLLNKLTGARTYIRGAAQAVLDQARIDLEKGSDGQLGAS